MGIRWVGLLIFVSGAPTYADIYNRQFLPLGERQAFMANAGVAHSADAGAGYFNPAGLAELDRNQVSLTANTYFIYNLEYDALLILDSETVPYEADGFNMIPMAANVAWGKGDWKIALSIMVPESLQVQNRVPVDTSVTEGQVLQSNLSQDVWGGLSIAKKLDERWSVGATFWGIQHSSVGVLALRILVPSVANTVVTSSTREELTVISGSATFGVSYLASPSTRFGLRIQTPTFRLMGSADYYQVSDEVTAGVLTSTETDRDDLKGYYRLPLDTTLGVSHQIGALELFFDMSLQLPIKYTAIPGIPDGSDFDSKLSPRWSLGADWAMSNLWALRAGLFYTPSAIRKLEIGSNDTKLDLWGATLGLLWRSGQIETSGGLFFLQGSGKSAPSSSTELFDASVTGYGAVLASSYLF